MLFINGPVVVVMAEQPVVIMCSLLDLLQEICERVCLIVAVFHESNAGGSAVRDNIVHRPIDLGQIFRASAYSSSEGISCAHHEM